MSTEKYWILALGHMILHMLRCLFYLIITTTAYNSLFISSSNFIIIFQSSAVVMCEQKGLYLLKANCHQAFKCCIIALFINLGFNSMSWFTVHLLAFKYWFFSCFVWKFDEHTVSMYSFCDRKGLFVPSLAGTNSSGCFTKLLAIV